jgi:uncharacterized cofD-like protein
MKNKTQERIVLIGGGGGVYRIAHFLKYIRPNITTIQTVFDDGGHSHVLRDERGMLPPGDIRQAILALSRDAGQPLLRQLLAFRFDKKKGSSLNGATFGNIMVTALTEITGDLPSAINEMCRIFGVTGTVLPVSLDNAHLSVTLSDGTVIQGEGKIDTRPISDPRTIISARLNPKAHIYISAYDAIVAADKIVFCPGDFWTSLMPNMLVDGFQDALQKTKAQTILVTNIMTKKAETDGYTSDSFAHRVCAYAGIKTIDTQLVNMSIIPPVIKATYELELARPVVVKQTTWATHLLVGDFADITNGIIRHNQHTVSTIADL